MFRGHFIIYKYCFHYMLCMVVLHPVVRDHTRKIQNPSKFCFCMLFKLNPTHVFNSANLSMRLRLIKIYKRRLDI